MSTTDDAKNLFRCLKNLDSTGSDWEPLTASELTSDLTRTQSYYDVKKYIDRGGMGAVYLAEDLRCGSQVAIKVLRPDMLCDARYLRRFEREIAVLKRLSHPNVVRILDDGTTRDGFPFFVMEWLEGNTLAKILDNQARLTLRQKQNIMADVCAALKYVHEQGVIHRDLKAGNIILAGTEERVVVLDFGVARDVSSTSGTTTRLHGNPGTHGHIAPELKHDRFAEANEVTDVFSLGVVFLNMLTGQIPDVGYRLPSEYGLAGFDEVLEKSLSQYPSDRYQSVAEFAKALTSLPDLNDGIVPEVRTRNGNLNGDLQVLPAVKADVLKKSPESLRGNLESKAKLSIRFPLPDELHQFHSLLASVSSARLEQLIKLPFEINNCSKIELKLLSVLDARQEAPRSTPSILTPKLISWSPDGRKIITACGAWGCTCWDAVRLSKLWSYQPKSSYALPMGVKWCSDEGFSERFMFRGSSNVSNYMEFYDTQIHNYREDEPRCVVWDDNTLTSFSWTKEFEPISPWRPGTTAFLISKRNELRLIDSRSIPGEQLEKRSFLEALFFKDVTYTTPSVKGLEGVSVDIQALGALDSVVVGYIWHPSGHFLALTTSSSIDDDRPSNVRIIHFDSAVVVVTISDAKACAWSKAGGLLLLDCGYQKGDKKQNNSIQRFKVWDCEKGMLRNITSAEVASKDFASVIADLTACGRSNASGELYFVVRGLSQYPKIYRGSDDIAMGDLPERVEDAAWSPSNSSLLATVGGEQAAHALRIWEVTPVG